MSIGYRKRKPEGIDLVSIRTVKAIPERQRRIKGE
jgi:hypothetical protein